MVLMEIVPYACQEQPDYLDNLFPGYRFCPMDSELILYYLKPKIDTGEHPKCRIYEVNLYSHGPEELTSQYRPCDDKWYFFTPRERKYQKGKVPNRRTGDFGCWKTTTKYISVYDHHDATGPRVVGTRRSLEYRDETGRKTSWLMQEYLVNDPNLPLESRQGANKVLNDWVLCKIYKKRTNETENIIAEAPHQVFASEELSLTNSTSEYQQNHSMSIPTNSFQSPHGASSASTSTKTQVNYVAQSRAYLSPVSNHMLQQHHSMVTATNSFQLSNGASSSTLSEPQQLPIYASPVTLPDVSPEDISQQNRSMLIATNSFRLSDGSSSSNSVETFVDDAQPPTYTSPMTSEDAIMNDINAFLLGDDDLEFDISQLLSFDDGSMTSQFT